MLQYEYLEPDKFINTDDFRFVENFLIDTKRTQIGWHYIIDLTWIYGIVKNWDKKLKILDAGGGRGPLQFLLAELGFDVENIDLMLSDPPLAYKRRYDADFHSLDSFSPTQYVDHIKSLSGAGKALLTRVAFRSPVYQKYKSYIYNRRHTQWRRDQGLGGQPLGRLSWIAGNLSHMPEIETDRYGAIVSLSALEHVPLDLLGSVMCELKRVVKPGGNWAITTSAANLENTFFHQPSQGYCFSRDDLCLYFDSVSAYEQDAENVLEKYRSCEYLQINLAEFYRKSGSNGMPWGVWNPLYIPVGLKSK